MTPEARAYLPNLAFVAADGQTPESPAQRLVPGFRRAATTDWLGPLEEGLRSIGRPELATLVLAVRLATANDAHPESATPTTG